MNKAVNELRLFLFTCSGEDNYILKRCKTRIQLWFAFIGFFVLLIFAGCFFSASCFSYSLFQGAKWASLPIGIFWGIMVVNMYLLLLHTISPAIIPLASKKKRKKNQSSSIDNAEKSSFLSLSMFMRLVFIMLLAIIIAQPLNVFVLSSTVITSIEKHKLQERVKLYTMTNKSLINNELRFQKDFQIKTNFDLTNENLKSVTFINAKIIGDSSFLNQTSKKLEQINALDVYWKLTKKQENLKTNLLNDIEILLNNELQSDENFLNKLNSISVPKNVEVDSNIFNTEISKLIQEKIDNYNALSQLLDRSNFYIKTIQLLLLENPLSWIITIIVCLVFLIPIGLKYYARTISAKMFFENNRENTALIKLRNELINTTNFSWLENKLKSNEINNIRTSDYYFQRMLIEHKIILEEYNKSKEAFSKELTKNITLFNKNSFKRLEPLLEKVKRINLKKYNEFKELIDLEYKNEVIVKYEYWLDCPFRTKRHFEIVIKETHGTFLDFVYNSTNKDEI